MNVSLPDILAFVTGAPSLPPLGFLPQPSIQFHATSAFPKANTCSNTLYLPLQRMTYDEFKYKILYGISNSFGFGQV